MEQLLIEVKNRAKEEWLVGYDSDQFYLLVADFWGEFQQLARGKAPVKIVLAELNPLKFLAAFLAAVAANCQVFLCNPHWGQREWQQVFELVEPDLLVGDRLSFWGLAQRRKGAKGEWREIGNCSSSAIMIPTGGTSGQIRFAIHTWSTLSASVAGFSRYFAEESVNCFCVLPLYHVSGLMQFLRSWLTGGRFSFLPYKALKKGFRAKIDPREFFVSLVPTQLRFLLDSDPGWLSEFPTVLLGGAPPWMSLLDTARKYNIRLAPTYGMTETASQIVTLKPADFLSGNNSSGQVLPHAQVIIRSDSGELLETCQTGIITIAAESLCLGYYPELFSNNSHQAAKLTTLKPVALATDGEHFVSANCLPSQAKADNSSSQNGMLQTDDLGVFDAQGYLTIIGRCSHKIITGGENVFPPEVEAAILATDLVQDVCVIGLPDCQWGEAVTAVYLPKASAISLEEIKNAMTGKLSQFKYPKYWLKVEQLPRNLQGKIDRPKIRDIALSQCRRRREFTPTQP